MERRNYSSRAIQKSSIENKFAVYTFNNYTNLETIMPEDYYYRFQYRQWLRFMVRRFVDGCQWVSICASVLAEASVGPSVAGASAGVHFGHPIGYRNVPIA
ncbi:Hypothetical predicted protein [Olea europaea subsp. europaea]|uniref:Uncharacterized protein n=1 Tax=Olea europaea subsp. europaea TaxID=158383 RepID=A0A8S0U065_OLEEU|nr:Hypothetical predicted protein [Olea europaea subsp. europaea]